jgi:nucleotide-binding universal stress UspA family protein
MVADSKIDKILFATRMMENAECEFRHVFNLASVQGAKVTILHVIESLPGNAELLLSAIQGCGNTAEFRRKSRDDMFVQIEKRIEKFCAAVEREKACRYVLDEIKVEQGDAAERILHHAGSETYAVLVIGSRGQSFLKQILTGGTSRKLIPKCPIPVLIVPTSRACECT